MDYKSYVECSNEQLDRRAVTSRHKTYVVNLQNGDFEQAGEHGAIERSSRWNSLVEGSRMV